MKIVKIDWVDSGANDIIWENKDSWELHVQECTSVGILVADDRNEVVICQSEHDYQFGRLFVIPKGCITNMEIVEL